MSLAHIDTAPRTTDPRRGHRPGADRPELVTVPGDRPATTPARPTAHLRPVPAGPEARGFALYIGFDEERAAEEGTDLASLVTALRDLTARIAPGSETYAAVALAPQGAGGRSVDVVRLALQEPGAVAAHRDEDTEQEPEAAAGVVVDISRKRLLLDDEPAPLTYKEFELLQYLVLREGRTIDRAELISALWNSQDRETVSERTIDVHVRRLRAKLGGYDEIVRTVRGVGYRYDRHADVSVRHASTPSPDRL